MCSIGGLKQQRCGDRIRCPRKFSNKCVTSNLVRDPTIVADRFRKSPERILYTFVRQSLVLLNERGRAHYIGVQEDGKLSFTHGKICY